MTATDPVLDLAARWHGFDDQILAAQRRNDDDAIAKTCHDQAAIAEALARTPADTIRAAAAKLRVAVMLDDMALARSALADLERLAGRAS